MDDTPHARCGLAPAELREILPEAPGVYLFRSRSGRVIYVGKAKNLRNRVLSYFRSAGRPLKTTLMMERADHLDFILTATEKDAFILESNLIKKFMPRYNIILRDDKRYPCLRLDTTETYPRLSIVRKIRKDGALYFGPFSSAHSVRSTMKVIDRVFQLRKCRGKDLPRRTRPCLNYQMDRCLGPCTHDVSPAAYRRVVEQVRLFLEGRNRELIRRLQREMAAAAEHLDFEQAAKIRDQVAAIEETVERQRMISPRMEDRDIIGLARAGDRFQIVLLFVRKGAMVGSRDYRFFSPGGTAPEVMEAFLKQYYLSAGFVPKEVLISEAVADLVPIMECLSEVSGKKIRIRRPRRGEKLRLVRMAVKNAENIVRRNGAPEGPALMTAVQSALRLKEIPRFIEGLDISNFQGDLAVGTVVSFVDGLPHRQGYRNYRIRAVQGIDDYGMMAELVSRRVSKGHLPDLFLVDGGKGHLSAVRSVISREAAEKAPEIAAIAKADETRGETWDRLYLPGRKNPLRLGPSHPVLLLMMRIRDEAHRRAVGYHRRLMRKELTTSSLDGIAGVGPRRKQLLLAHFPDAAAIARAGVEDLCRVPGISRSLALRIVSSLAARDPENAT